MFFKLASKFDHYATFDLNYILIDQIFVYNGIYLLLRSLVYFFPVMILKTCIFRSTVSFGTDTLLDNSLRVLELSTYLSYLTGNE